MHQVTGIAPVNIAVIKYWGKRDEDLILPVNDSLSVTLNTDEMCAKTTVAASPDFKENRMWLNGEEVSFENNKRLLKCVEEVQKLAKVKGSSKISEKWKIHIASENNFPTAAGLASSAAGYACLVYTLALLYGVDNEELSIVARQGSGSACRSIYGGFVHWIKGQERNGLDSLAIQIAPALHWPEMHILILVVNDNKKKTSSTIGMKRSVETSDLLSYRAEKCVPQRIDAIKEAIKKKDFDKFAEITMKDSNQFHAVALDTYPPCIYMNDTSHEIAEFVHNYNKANGSIKVAYTFDAGPNACLYLLKDEVEKVLSTILYCFPNDAGSDVEYLKGIPIDKNLLRSSDVKKDDLLPIKRKNLLKYIIHTKVGDGPKALADVESLLDSNGLPKAFKNQ